MQIKSQTARILCGILGVLILTPPASALVPTLDLAPPPATYASQTFTGDWYPGVGNRRSFIFEAVSAFAMSSVGIEVNPVGTTSFTAALHQVTGVDTPGALLATNTVALPDVNRSFYDVPLPYAFPGTSARYLLDISWPIDPSEAVFYEFEGLGDLGEPIDPSYIVGPIRMIDGKNGAGLGEDNYVPHFHVNLIPEPTGLWVLASALPLLRRRR